MNSKIKASEFYSNYKWQLSLGIFVLALALNANTFNHSFVLDDTIAIEKNVHVQKGLQGIRDIFIRSYTNGYDGTNRNTYRPISLVSFAIEKEFFGASPFPFHLFNVIWYALLCVVVAQFIFLIFPEKRTFFLISIIVLFTAHPIHTEVVANIKSRDEIFSMLFGITSLVFLLKYDTDKKYGPLILSLFFFLLSIFSKENTITLIAIFPLTLYFFRNYTLKQAMSVCWIYLLPLGLLFLSRSIILDDFITTSTSNAKWDVPYNNTLFAATNYSEELATNASIFLKYLQLATIPISLVSDYSIETFEIVNFTNIRAIMGLFAILGLSVFSLIRMKNRAEDAYAILFFLITFSITSNFFFKIGSTLGERFLFLPSLGIVILIGILIFKYSSSILSFLFIAVILCFYSWKTIDRNKDWKNIDTLSLQDIKTNPGSTRLLDAVAKMHHRNLLKATDPQQKRKEAHASINYYTESLKHQPNKDVVNFDIGNVYSLISDYQSALKFYKKAIPATSVKEDELYYNLGICYEQLNEYSESITAFEKAIKLQPGIGDYWRHLAFVSFANKDFHKSIEAFTKSIELKAGNRVDDLLNIAVSYHILKDYTNAKKYYNEVLKIDPENSKAKANLSAIRK